MHRLVVNPGTPQAWEIQLRPGSNYIGRGPGNDFTIHDPSVSSSHCQILVEDDVIRIKDLGSTNGTLVDQQSIQETILKSGQRIQLGSVEMLSETITATAPATINLAGIARMEIPAAPTAPAPPRAAPIVPPPIPEIGRSVGSVGSVGSVIAPVAAMVVASPGTTAATSPMPAPKPVAVATPPPVSSAPPAAIEELTPVFCKNHYSNAALYKCERCNRYLCDLCVNTRGSAGGGLKSCKICGDACAPVSIKAHVPKELNFFKAAPKAFRYPLMGDGLILLLCGAVFFGVLDGANYVSLHAGKYALRAMMMRSVMFTFIFGTGYLFSYLKQIIYATANGDQRMPDWPDFTEWQADILAPMFHFLIVSVASFGPALIVGIWTEWDQMWLVWLAMLAGCVYFPMGMLAVAMFDSLAALNPRFILPSILRLRREYSLAVLVFAGIIGVRWLTEAVLKTLIPIPLLPALLADLIGIYFLIVETRILGLLYYCHKDALGWFQKRQSIPAIETKAGA